MRFVKTFQQHASISRPLELLAYFDRQVVVPGQSQQRLPMMKGFRMHSLPLIDLHQPHMWPEVHGIQLYSLQEQVRRLVVPARVVKRETNRGVEVSREWIKLTGLAGFTDGLIKSSLRRQEEGVQIMRQRLARIQFNGLSAIAFCASPVPLIKESDRRLRVPGLSH